MIHCFQFDDLNIVLDVHSGAVHVMDELAFKVLEYYPHLGRRAIVEKFSAEYDRETVEETTVEETIEEIDNLVAAGLLFSRDEVGPQYIPGESKIIKAMCLHIAHDCNLRCRYCFAGQGPFGGDRSLMSEQVGRAALDLLMEYSGPRRHVEVDFFGGEPLLNFGVLKKLVDYGRGAAGRAGKKVKFTVTTNSVLLNDHVKDYLKKEGISVVLSLDGRPAVHDAMRPFAGGAGSYDIVSANIIDLIKNYGVWDYVVRGTFTRHNLDFAADVLHMAELGFKNLSVEPVVGAPEEDYTFRDQDLPVLYAEYDKLTRWLLALRRKDPGVNFFHFNIDLEGGPCLKKRLSNCGAGNEYVAVTPAGDIYPCHQFVGQEDFKLGDVFHKDLNERIRDYFRRGHIYNKESCPACWAKFFCSGGCQANAFFSHGTIYKPYEPACKLMKKRLECALYLKAKEMLMKE